MGWDGMATPTEHTKHWCVFYVVFPAPQCVVDVDPTVNDDGECFQLRFPCELV